MSVYKTYVNDRITEQMMDAQILMHIVSSISPPDYYSSYHEVFHELVHTHGYGIDDVNRVVSLLNKHWGMSIQKVKE